MYTLPTAARKRVPLVSAGARFPGSMTPPEALATQLTRCVELFRDPKRTEDQKAALRDLLSLLREGGLSLRQDGTGLRVNGAQLESAALGPLIHRLSLHNVSEIMMPRQPPPGEVFQLVMAIAERPRADNVATRLRADGA